MKTLFFEIRLLGIATFQQYKDIIFKHLKNFYQNEFFFNLNI
jgi:hypothetical protein